MRQKTLEKSNPITPRLKNNNNNFFQRLIIGSKSVYLIELSIQIVVALRSVSDSLCWSMFARNRQTKTVNFLFFNIVNCKTKRNFVISDCESSWGRERGSRGKDDITAFLHLGNRNCKLLTGIKRKLWFRNYFQVVFASGDNHKTRQTEVKLWKYRWHFLWTFPFQPTKALKISKRHWRHDISRWSQNRQITKPINPTRRQINL